MAFPPLPIQVKHFDNNSLGHRIELGSSSCALFFLVRSGTFPRTPSASYKTSINGALSYPIYGSSICLFFIYIFIYYYYYYHYYYYYNIFFLPISILIFMKAWENSSISGRVDSMPFNRGRSDYLLLLCFCLTLVRLP